MAVKRTAEKDRNSLTMKPLLEPVDRALLIKELDASKFIRNTNKGGNQLYIVTAQDSPNVMREIGRLREWSFRLDGGGSGEPIDISPYDSMEKPYKQLIVWDPEAQEITGGYRYIHGQDVVLLPDGQPKIVMAHMFDFSEKFIKEYLPYTIELGRAFIHPDYQSSKMGAKSIFAFDNLWDGLLVLNYFEPEVRYVMGKVTVYQDTKEIVQKAIFYFLNHVCAGERGLMTCKKTFFGPDTKVEPEIEAIFEGCDSRMDKFNALSKFARTHGENVPPLISSYFKLSNQMSVFGTGINTGFGDIIDTAMMVKVSEIDPQRWSRHVDSFLRDRAFREENHIIEDAAHPLTKA